METYHFMSKVTGEIVTDLRSAIKTTFSDLIHYHIFHIWKYSRSGF